MSAAPIDGLLSKLDGVKETRPGKWRARCPAHEGKSLSLSIAEADSGAALLHCFSGCGAIEVLAAVGLQLPDLYPKDSVIQSRRYDRTLRKDCRARLFQLAHSATVVQVAGEHISQGKVLSEVDMHDLRAACEAIRKAAA